MVYKVFGQTGKSYLFEEWKSPNNLSCVIDDTKLHIPDVYIFYYKKYSLHSLEEFFNDYNKNGKLIYLYSNLYYEEIKDFIEFLETLKHNFIIFIRE